MRIIRNKLLIFLLLRWTILSTGFVSIQPTVNPAPRTIASRPGSRSKNIRRHQRPVTLSASSSKKTGFDWATEWYPVVPEQDLNSEIPNKITLLGKDFAVWFHEPSQEWRAFADECPHRLVPLSEGRIESNGMLQCAYHGWEFDQDGGCTRIPQLNGQNPTTSGLMQSPRACATSFPARVEQGLLWIFPTADQALAKSKEPALIAELDDPENVDGTNFFVRDMPYSWDILVENLSDPAHVPFAHHSFMRGADRNQGSTQPDIKVTEETPQGFRAEKDPGTGQYDVNFQAPCLLYYKISNSAALEKGKSGDPTISNNFIGLGQYCIPTAPGRCRLIARFPMRIGFKPVMWIMRHTPRWMTHLDQNVVMDSDVVFLCSQDEQLATKKDRNKPDYFLPSRSDSMVTAFRKWLISAGGDPKWLGIPAARSAGEPLGWIRPQRVPVREGRDALLDRYRQHTDVCSSCRRAHKTIYAIREALTYSGILCLATAAGITGRKTRIALAIAGGLSLIAPRLLLTPLIASFECMPWPRKKWIAPSDGKKVKKVRV